MNNKHYADLLFSRMALVPVIRSSSCRQLALLRCITVQQHSRALSSLLVNSSGTCENCQQKRLFKSFESQRNLLKGNICYKGTTRRFASEVSCYLWNPIASEQSVGVDSILSRPPPPSYLSIMTRGCGLDYVCYISVIPVLGTEKPNFTSTYL